MPLPDCIRLPASADFHGMSLAEDENDLRAHIYAVHLRDGAMMELVV